MRHNTTFELKPFRCENLQAFFALCGLMRILSESKPEWKLVCRWEKADDTRGFRLEVKLSAIVKQDKFIETVYKEVKKNLGGMKKNWVEGKTKEKDYLSKNEGTILPLFCGYEIDKKGKLKLNKSPFWMSDVNPKTTAEKSFNNLTKQHIHDSLFDEWDYGERSRDKTRTGDKNKYTPVGNFCWDPNASSRTHDKLGYPPKEESPPVEAGANALAGCGWDLFPCVPQAKGVVAPCYFKEKYPNTVVQYPIWNQWLDFEQMKSLLWTNWNKSQNLPEMGIKALVSVQIQISENGGKRALQGRITKEF